MKPEYDSEEFRVNVPMDSVEKMIDAPDEGYALVKYKKDGEAFCLSLESLRLPEVQPMTEEEEEGEFDTLEDALKKEVERTTEEEEDEEEYEED